MTRLTTDDVVSAVTADFQPHGVFAEDVADVTVDRIDDTTTYIRVAGRAGEYIAITVREDRSRDSRADAIVDLLGGPEEEDYDPRSDARAIGNDVAAGRLDPSDVTEATSYQRAVDTGTESEWWEAYHEAREEHPDE